NWLTIGYEQVAVVFPYIVAAPRYFSGAIELGGLMQTASAFGHVQRALSWFINAFSGSAGSNSIAGWKAVVGRLTGFENQLVAIATAGQGEVAHKAGDAAAGVAINGLDLTLPDGRVLLRDLSLTLPPGSRTLITGPSGSGKSTLFRTLGGIWPYAKG